MPFIGQMHLIYLAILYSIGLIVRGSLELEYTGEYSYYRGISHQNYTTPTDLGGNISFTIYSTPTMPPSQIRCKNSICMSYDPNFTVFATLTEVYPLTTDSFDPFPNTSSALDM